MPKQIPAFEALGLQVDFFCRRLPRPQIPRIGWVTGAGEKNEERGANLTFFHHPILDVSNGQKPMLASARGVPVYDEDFAKGDQAPAHYAVVRPGQQLLMQVAQKPEGNTDDDGDDLGDLSQDNDVARRQPGDDPDPETIPAKENGPAKGKNAKAADLSASESAIRKLIDDEQTDAAVERIKEASCELKIDANGATIVNDAGFAVGVIGFEPERPNDGFTLETILPNGRGMDLVVSGINNTKKTRPGMTVFAFMDFVAEICEAADGQTSLKAVGRAIEPVVKKMRAVKK